MAECMRAGLFGDTCHANCQLHGVLHRLFKYVIPLQSAIVRIGCQTASRENELPAPLPFCAWILDAIGIWQRHQPSTILIKMKFKPGQMFMQRRNNGFRKSYLAMFSSFAVLHRNRHALKINILDAQSNHFTNTQPATVLKLCGQFCSPPHCGQNPDHF